MMSLEEEIRIIRFAQGIYPDSHLLDRFRQLDREGQKSELMNISFLEWGLTAIDSDIEPAIAASGLQDTDLPVVYLRKDRIQTNRTGILPDSELEKGYLLYFHLFKTAYQRSSKVEKEKQTNWWFQDLSSDETVQVFVEGYQKLIDEIYADKGFQGEFVSLAKFQIKDQMMLQKSLEEPTFNNKTQFDFLSYDEMVTNYAKLFDHKSSQGITLVRHSLNKALSIRYKIDPSRVWRIISDVIDRHVDYQNRLNKIYEAFNNRDIDAVLAHLHADVDWPNGWEGGYVHGHDEVRDYWTRQWQEIDPRVTPVSFHLRSGGEIEVDVYQFIKDLEGRVVADGQVKHIYTLIDGKIKRMAIE